MSELEIMVDMHRDLEAAEERARAAEAEAILLRDEIAPRLLTVPEVRKRLMLGRTHVYELMARGELESVLVGRNRRVPEASLDAFIAGRNNPRPLRTKKMPQGRLERIEAKLDRLLAMQLGHGE